jgi:hypothetical protein
MPGFAASDRPPAVETTSGRAADGPLKPVTDHSVWKASDFRDGSWIASLSEEHVQEIEAAIGATIHEHEGRFGRGHVPDVSSPSASFLRLLTCFGLCKPIAKALLTVCCPLDGALVRS